MNATYDCLALFSGGLDSLLSCRLMQQQDLRVLAVHFLSPFFGKSEKVSYWQEEHGIDILPVDIGEEYVRMLAGGPKWGLGKHLNPCVDCKIFMLRKTREMLSLFGASFIVSGEVVGQRPMSQHMEAMGRISREAEVNGLLLRPLCAPHLSPTPMEESGLVDREKLPDIKGRSRKRQLELAEQLGIRDVPTPAGGCLLTDPESSRRFWPLLANMDSPSAGDFELAKLGRQYWNKGHWMIIGRNQQDNQAITDLVQSRDIVFKLADIPGPLAVARQYRQKWSSEMIESAARLLVSFSPKARSAREEVRIKAGSGGFLRDVFVHPDEEIDPEWGEPRHEDLQQEKKEYLLS